MCESAELIVSVNPRTNQNTKEVLQRFKEMIKN
jgi:hypothetical protein